jgi:hypothetical protein
VLESAARWPQHRVPHVVVNHERRDPARRGVQRRARARAPDPGQAPATGPGAVPRAARHTQDEGPRLNHETGLAEHHARRAAAHGDLGLRPEGVGWSGASTLGRRRADSARRARAALPREPLAGGKREVIAVGTNRARAGAARTGCRPRCRWQRGICVCRLPVARDRRAESAAARRFEATVACLGLNWQPRRAPSAVTSMCRSSGRQRSSSSALRAEARDAGGFTDDLRRGQRAAARDCEQRRS